MELQSSQTHRDRIYVFGLAEPELQHKKHYLEAAYVISSDVDFLRKNKVT
jgi:hypothetical protein